MDYGLEIGMNYTIEHIVKKDDIASVVGSGMVDVFATPAMITLMELAARSTVQSKLDSGYTTVGTMVNIEHLRATPLGASVRGHATLVSIEGRKLSFEIEAHDDKGLIGKGTHSRVIIDVKRFMEGITKD